MFAVCSETLKVGDFFDSFLFFYPIFSSTSLSICILSFSLKFMNQCAYSGWVPILFF